jgi:effector-binding domain-containing protein
MEHKQIEMQPVFYKTVKTNLKNIGQYVGNMPAQLMEDLAKEGLQPEGPQIWRYIGSDGNIETEFDLQVGIPVSEKREGDERFSEFEPFKCASFIHKGSWSEFGKVYERIIGEVMVAGHKMNGETREIYHNCDFENEQNNVTEIQIGIE